MGLFHFAPVSLGPVSLAKGINLIFLAKTHMLTLAFSTHRLAFSTYRLAFSAHRLTTHRLTTHRLAFSAHRLTTHRLTTPTLS